VQGSADARSQRSPLRSVRRLRLLPADEVVEAKSLVGGAAATVRHHFSQLRVLGGVSYYSLRVRARNAKYHDIHIRQLEMLSKVVNDHVFADLAAQLKSDHDPIQQP
jgi:D-glucuronyl C5-epimerase C-terminus